MMKMRILKEAKDLKLKHMSQMILMIIWIIYLKKMMKKLSLKTQCDLILENQYFKKEKLIAMIILKIFN